MNQPRILPAMKTLLIGDAAKMNFKTIGLSVDDIAWPLLVMTPNFYAIQLSGPDAKDDPITRLFLDMGFTRLSDGPIDEGGALPEATTRWSGHLRSNGSWWIEHEGELFKDRHAPEPKMWSDAVRSFEHIIVYYVPEHVGEINGAQTVEALRKGQGLVLVVPVGQ